MLGISILRDKRSEYFTQGTKILGTSVLWASVRSTLLRIRESWVHASHQLRSLVQMERLRFVDCSFFLLDLKG
jgi:hypothetical protein